MKKKVLAAVLALSMMFSMAMPAAAQGTGYNWSAPAAVQAAGDSADGFGADMWKDVPLWSEGHPVWDGAASVAAYALEEQATDETAVQSDDAAQDRPQPGDVVYYNDQIAFTVNEDGETCSVGYNTQKGYPSGKIEIPSQIELAPGIVFTVTGIAQGGFAQCDQVTEIVLPDTLQYIGAGAFFYTAISSIHIPASVTTIEAVYALPTFACPIMTEITVDEANPNFTVVDGVLFDKDKTTLYAYPAAKGDTSYSIPEGVTKIAAGAFVYAGAFAGLDHFDVTCPDSLKQIEGNAFNTSVLTSISLPFGLTSVFSDFYYDTDLQMSGLSACPLLTHIEMRGESDLFTVENDALIDHNVLGTGMDGLIVYAAHKDAEEFVIPEGVVTIAPYAFLQMEGSLPNGSPLVYTLKKVVCPSTLQDIGAYAFDNCISMESISLPHALQFIEPYAFNYSPKLQNVYYDGSEEDRSKMTIGEGNSRLTSATWHYTGAEPTATPAEPTATPEPTTAPTATPTAAPTAPPTAEPTTAPTTAPTATPSPWTYELKDGVLTISGEGWMNNLPSARRQPWYSHRDEITSVVIEDGITAIGDFDFYGLPNLTDVTIADSVTEIGEYAFKNCTALKNVKLPANLEIVCVSAFYGCTAFDAITIPAKVDTVQDYAFARCSGVNTITFEGSAPGIGEAAFAGITASVSYPEEDTSWTDEVKQNYGGKLLWNQPLAWTLEDGVLTIADDSCMDDYDSAAQVPWNAKRSEITRVVLNDGVTKIPDFAFYGCTNLTSVEIPESVVSIGAYAFKKCENLNSIALPANLTQIGESAFYGCSSLTEVTFPAGIEQIADYAFARSTQLRTIAFEGNAPAIAAHAFAGVSANAACPENNETWADKKQNYGGDLKWNSTDHKLPCGEAAYWELTDGVLTISGSGAMANYDSAAQRPWNSESANITSVVVEDGVTNVGSFAFYGMTNLTSVTLADSVETIGAYAFKKCSGIREITLPASLTAIQDSAFYGCEKISSITIPANVTKIGAYAFSRCAALKTIVFEGSAPVIGEYAFSKVTAEAQYQGSDSSWTTDRMQNYGGKIQWTAI